VHRQQQAVPQRTAEERAILAILARSFKRPMTKQEQHLALEQARALDEDGDAALVSALGRDASEANKKRWLVCFQETILLLHSNDQVSCSFGTTKENDTGFWKHRATIPIRVSYESWVANKCGLIGSGTNTANRRRSGSYYWGHAT
jgi:hypothetical protein